MTKAHVMTHQSDKLKEHVTTCQTEEFEVTLDNIIQPEYFEVQDQVTLQSEELEAYQTAQMK